MSQGWKFHVTCHRVFPLSTHFCTVIVKCNIQERKNRYFPLFLSFSPDSIISFPPSGLFFFDFHISTRRMTHALLLDFSMLFHRYFYNCISGTDKGTFFHSEEFSIFVKIYYLKGLKTSISLVEVFEDLLDFIRLKIIPFNIWSNFHPLKITVCCFSLSHSQFHSLKKSWKNFLF